MPESLSAMPPPDDRGVHVASLVVHARPEEAEALETRLSALPGVEGVIRDGGRMAVVVEVETEDDLVRLLETITLAEGVQASAPVFHHHEPAVEGGPS